VPLAVAGSRKAISPLALCPSPINTSCTAILLGSVLPSTPSMVVWMTEIVSLRTSASPTNLAIWIGVLRTRRHGWNGLFVYVMVCFRKVRHRPRAAGAARATMDQY
jgi:hypothetical protein